MRLLLLLLAIFTGAWSLKAQVPMQFSYQSVLRNNEGAVVSNQNVSIRITIVNNNNDVFFEEFHSVRTDGLG